MPIPDKFYDQVGNEVSLNKLCRIEPDWAANVIRTLHKQYDELFERTCQPTVQADAEKLSAMVGWLEKNQPDVFARGIWDSIRTA